MRYQLSNPELVFNPQSSRPVNFQQLGVEEYGTVRVRPPLPKEPPPPPKEPTADEQLADDVCAMGAGASQTELDRIWTRIYSSESGPAGIRNKVREKCGKLKLPRRFTPCNPGEVRQYDEASKEYICAPPKPPATAWCPRGQESVYRGGRWDCETPRAPSPPLPRRGPEQQRPGACPPGYIRRPVPPYDCLPPVATGEQNIPMPLPISVAPVQAPTDTPILTPTPTPSLTPTPAPLVPTPTPTSSLPSMPFGLPMDSSPMVAPDMSGTGFLGQVRLVRCP